jgi:trk system potassium uptake protein TrkH
MLRVFALIIGGALCFSLPALVLHRKSRFLISAGDGLLLVFLAWVLVCLLGALPYFMAGRLPNLADAVFESASGFTTTGATVISDVEIMPRSLLLWRAMTHWLGGMGIVVLTVALFPLLGIGGFQLLKAETPGPEKEKFTPKITATAKILWLLYIALTGIQTLLLRAGGMSWFDAAVHALATISTGGFSSRNNSIAAYGSPWIDWVCITFMFLSGLNFSLFYRLLKGKRREVLNNSEAKVYGGIFLAAGGLIVLSFSLSGGGPGQNLRHALFQTASILTSTGFTSTDYSFWPPLAQGALFLLMFIGGCSGSTSGGVKVIRHVILFKQAGNEIKKILYPKGVFSIRLNKKVGRKNVLYGVTGFIFLYGLLACAGALLVSLSGPDIFSSLNASLLCLGNIGIGLGTMGAGSGFKEFPAYCKWGLSFIMITGRLELWTAFVFFSGDYWRK